MPIQQRVLEAALRLCRARGGWTFRPAEIVAALADLNPGSVRTHVMSRCCVNAPSHHSHRWPHFRRVRRGVYEILPAQRRRRGSEAGPPVRYQARPGERTRVEIMERAGRYVARVHGVPGDIRGATLDGVAHRLREMAREHGPLGVLIDLDPEIESPDPVVAVFEKDIDRTQIRRNLRRTPEERLVELQQWIGATDEIRGAAWKATTGQKE